jgi:large subunit ribosomal protein L22
MYTTSFNEKTMARAQAVSLPVSLKQSAEVCRFIRNRKYNQAIRLLESVVSMKTAVPYTRFNRGGTGHRPGMGPGRYPVKVCNQMLKLLRSVNANAIQKGLDTNSLVIKAVVAKQGPKVLKYGRKRGRIAKRTHIEIIVEESKQKTDTAKTAAANLKIKTGKGGKRINQTKATDKK